MLKKIQTSPVKSSAFYALGGMVVGDMTDQEARTRGWPTENSSGSTVRYSQWETYRGERLGETEWDEADGLVKKELRPRGWSETVLVQEEMEDHMLARAGEFPIYRDARTPSDRVDKNLLADLKKLRKGELDPKDPK